jgi:hypothetical protein
MPSVAAIDVCCECNDKVSDLMNKNNFTKQPILEQLSIVLSLI